MQAPPKPRPRVISAGYTPLLKWGLPGLSLVQWLTYMVTWARMQRLHEPTPPLLRLYIAGSAVLCLWVGWSFLRLKRVAYTEKDLHVSNYRRDIVVPLRNVASVGRTLVGMNAIVIQLVDDSEFGRRLTFIPKRMFHPLVWTHPTVDRLRDAVAAAKVSATGQPGQSGQTGKGGQTGPASQKRGATP